MTTGDTGQGVWLLCACFTAPLVIGALAGWWLHGRVITLGLPWAFMPGIIKRLVYKLWEYGGNLP